MHLKSTGIKNNEFLYCTISLTQDGSDVGMSDHSFASNLFGNLDTLQAQDECVITIELLHPQAKTLYQNCLDTLDSKNKINHNNLKFKIIKDFSVLCDKKTFNVTDLKKWLSKMHFNVIQYNFRSQIPSI